MQLKNILIITTVTTAILLIPLIYKWPWTTGDFLIAAILILGVGVVLDFVRNSTKKYRLATAIVVAFLFMWLWAELAVGVFTNWGS